MLTHLRALTIAICVCALVASESRAQNVYEFLFTQSTYTAANPGDSVPVTVILRETVVDETARLAPGLDDGLISLGVQTLFGNVTGGPGSTANSATTRPSATRFSTDDEITEVLPTFVNVDNTENSAIAGVVDGIGVNGVMTTAGVYELELFDIDFTAGAAGSITDLELADLTAFDGFPFFTPSQNFFGDSLVIDGTATFGTSQIIVDGAAVPEPGSLLALGALMMGGMLRRRRG